MRDELGPDVEVESHIEPLQMDRLSGQDAPPARVEAVRAVGVAVAKAAREAARQLGRGGGPSLPGLIAQTIDPGIVAEMAAQIALAKTSPNQREPRQIGPSKEGPLFLT